MNRKTTAVQVPGEVPQNDEDVTQADQPEGELPVTAAPADEENVSVPKAQLDALLSRLDALESVNRRESSVRNGVALPDAADIDISTLKAPILTKQGWLVPEKFGSNPAAQKAL